MDLKNHFLQHIAGIAIMILVAGVYFFPEMQGKKLLSHDEVSSIAAAKEMHNYEEKGETILWTSRLFSGMPAFQVAYAVKANLLYVFFKPNLILPKNIWLFVSMMLGFYICLSLLGYGIETRLIGAIAFGLSTWFMISMEAGHATKLLTISFIPPLLASIVISYKGKWLLGGILTSLFLALAIMSNHIQIIYYALFMVLILFIVKLIAAIKQKTTPTFFKRTLILIGFAILGILPNTTIIWTTYDYGKETIRGGKSELTSLDDVKQTTGLDIDYAMQYSYGKAESINLLIPGFAASGAKLSEESETYNDLKSKGVPKAQIKDYLKGIPTYYGEPPVNSGPSYFGAAIIFLFLLLFFIYKGNIRWALLSIVILSIITAWGRHFLVLNEFLFDHLPLYNKFRTPSMWLSIGMIAIVWGAMIALKTLFKGDYNKDKIKKSLLYTGGILGGFVIFVYLFKSSITDFSGPYDSQLEQNGLNLNSLIDDRINMLTSDVLRTLFILGLMFGTIWLFVTNKLKNVKLTYFIFAIIIIADLWSVDKRFLNEDDFTKIKSYEKSIVASPADQHILKDTEVNYRVFNTTVSSFNDNNTSYFHQSVGGYSAVKLMRYQELIERHLSKGNMNVFNMLNTKYFITGQPQQETAQLNPTALGSVWFVNNIDWAKNADDEMAKLTEFNPAQTAIIDERFKNDIGDFNLNANDNSGQISLTLFHPDNMVYSSNSAVSKFAVFSEIWYKGNVDWKAYIDGKETEFTRVNYLLRGLKVPAGQHKIEFKFYPKSHYIGSKITLVSSGLILLLVIGLFAALILKKPLPGIKFDESKNDVKS
jgi:hypothetical protein